MSRWRSEEVGERCARLERKRKSPKERCHNSVKKWQNICSDQRTEIEKKFKNSSCSSKVKTLASC